jgi:predicted DNA-binding WGR domain protein
MRKHYFEFTQGTSNKFWEIEFSESGFKVRWGRCGSSGQTKEKFFESKAEAIKKGEQLIKEKLKEGYLEITVDAGFGQKSAEVSTAVSSSKQVKASKTALQSTSLQTKPSNLSQDASTQSVLSSVSTLSTPSFGEAKPQISIETKIISEGRTLGLTQDELRWAPWRKISPVPAHAPEPFDMEEGLKKLKSIKFGQYGWRADWSGVRLPMYMSRIEAHFWVEAMVNLMRDKTLEKQWIQNLINHMQSFQPTGDLSFETAVSLFTGKSSQLVSSDIVLPLFYLLEIEQLCELMTTPLGSDYSGRRIEIYDFADSFRRLVLPHLTSEQLERCRAFLRTKIGKKAWPASFQPVPVAFLLASPLGMYEELLEVVESWPDDLCSHNYYGQRHPEVIFGLGDPSLVNLHMRRLKLSLCEPQYIKAWLAHMEFSNFDLIVSTINRNTNKETAESLIKAFSCVKSPEAAVAMLEIYLGSKAPRIAKEWIEQNRYHSIEGFAAIAGGNGKTADAAIDMLRTFHAQGLTETISQISSSLPESTRQRIRTEVLENEALSAPLLDETTTPKRLASFLAEVPSKARVPLWLTVDELPPILAKKCRFTREQTTAVLLHLINPIPGKTLELFEEIKKEGDPASLENFGWKLFELWLGIGAPSKEKWAFAALGYTGGDSTALKLSPMIRAWPGESQHQRAVAGLEVLRAIGTDTALMQLNGIAQKVQFKGLKQRANECMDLIAKDKGLTKAELEDRIVPDCGLDERGSYEFDFGTRKFTFVLGSDMKPMVRDVEGKLRDDLPKPNLKDDHEKATAAISAWKLMKKQIREVAKIQAGRLEQAMIIGRQWTRQQFEMLLVRHPLMVHLTRMLVWAGYSEAGTFIKTFRVTEEGDYADETDSEVDLDQFSRIGIIHPLNLTGHSAGAWGELFSDYEIIPPFPQLGRAVYTLDQAELKSDTIARFVGMKFPAPTLVFTLEKFGWARGTPMDAGCFDEHSKQFPAADVTVVVTYDGIASMGYILPEEDLTITDIYFVKGMREPTGYAHKEKKIALEKVDRVVISEVLYDLSSLAAKAK